MKITNIEKIIGWTPPGNPAGLPIVTDTETSIVDYTFKIRYIGEQYTVTIMRDYVTGDGYPMVISRYGDPCEYDWHLWNAELMDIPTLYDKLNAMLSRIRHGSFDRFYPKKK